MKRAMATKIADALREWSHTGRNLSGDDDEGWGEPEKALIAAVQRHTWTRYREQVPPVGVPLLWKNLPKGDVTVRSYRHAEAPEWRRFIEPWSGHFYVARPEHLWMLVPE